MRSGSRLGGSYEGSQGYPSTSQLGFPPVGATSGVSIVENPTLRRNLREAALLVVATALDGAAGWPLQPPQPTADRLEVGVTHILPAGRGLLFQRGHAVHQDLGAKHGVGCGLAGPPA